jgi:hypothetical protein
VHGVAPLEGVLGSGATPAAVASLWDGLVAALPSDLRLQPLGAYSCADFDACVGVVRRGRWGADMDGGGRVELGAGAGVEDECICYT